MTKIFLRLPKNQMAKIKVIKSKKFVPSKPIKLKIFPIPKFIENPKCKYCGGIPNYLLEDFTLICNKCLNKILEVTSELKEVPDLDVIIDFEIIKKLSFEFSFNGDQWYRVKGSNLIIRDKEKFVEKLKQSIINGSKIEIFGDYVKDSKILIISSIV